MINKERLIELIKEKAKVYFMYNESFIAGYSSIAKIKELDLSDFKPIYFTSSNIENDFVAIKSTDLTVDRNDFENLFETKEDAEEYLKYGNKTRIVKFEAPNWEELQKMVTDTKEWSVSFRIDCSHSQDLIVMVCKTIGTMDEEQPYIIRLRQLYTCEVIDFEYSREGYDKARDLCLKLFMGKEE